MYVTIVSTSVPISFFSPRSNFFFVILRRTSHLLDNLRFEVRWWQSSKSIRRLLHSIISCHHYLYHIRLNTDSWCCYYPPLNLSFSTISWPSFISNHIPFLYLPLFWAFKLDTASIVTVFIASAEAFGM